MWANGYRGQQRGEGMKQQDVAVMVNSWQSTKWVQEKGMLRTKFKLRNLYLHHSGELEMEGWQV